MIAVVRALVSLSRIFREHQVRWAVVGSMASSVHGVVRTTQDLDIVVSIPTTRLVALTEALSPEFAVDLELVRENFAKGRSANIFYKGDFFKIDLFPVVGDPDQIAQLERACIERVEVGDQSLSVPVSTAEDMLIAKLKWWRETGSSPKQWEDLRGIVRICGDRMDMDYIRQWAARAGFDYALRQLLAEAHRNG